LSEENAVKIYVGNLSYNSTEADIRTEFEAYGKVDSVNLIIDRDTGRVKGFGFVEMSSTSEAKAAMAALNGKSLRERSIVVNEAKPRSDNSSGGYRDRSSGGYSGRRDRE
jgi:RNA recognition motif-containing protein